MPNLTETTGDSHIYGIIHREFASWSPCALPAHERVPSRDITGPDINLSVDEYSAWNQSELDRHRVSRRSMLKGLAAGAGGIALAQFTLANRAFAAGGGTPGTSGVVIAGRHLAFASGDGCFLHNSMALTAQLVSSTATLPGKLRGWVEVGDRPGHYGRKYEANIVNLVGMYAIPGGPVGNQFYLKATMTGLRAHTLHHYRVRLSDGTVSGDAYFTTAPQRTFGLLDLRAADPFTFTAFGDVGTSAAPIDPAYAWANDPAAVTAAKGAWPKGIFDNNYYNAADPVAGTNGTDPTPPATVTNLMTLQKPVFTLLAGDICYADPSGTGLPADNTKALAGSTPAGKNNYNPYVWDVFFNQIEPLAAFSPMMFATGNHDMEPLYGNTKFIGDSDNHGYGGHEARLDLPTNGPSKCPSVYSFIYGNVGVISVDANDLSFEIGTNSGYSGGAQLAWIEQTLKEWRMNPFVAPTVDFVVAFFHHCAYSTTNQHASDGGVRGALEPLFSQYQVDLVVQGHNHLMERTDPIKNGVKTKDAPDGATISPKSDGVTYLCVGSGGRPRYAFRPAPSASAPAPAGVTATGAQTLPEGQRYRGYAPTGGHNTSENNTTVVENSYLWSDAGTTTANGYPFGIKVPEAIDWSQVRYDDYAFIAVDVVPARRGRPTTFTVRTLADALPSSGEKYTEVDRITFRRLAGMNKIEQ